MRLRGGFGLVALTSSFLSACFSPNDTDGGGASASDTGATGTDGTQTEPTATDPDATTPTDADATATTPDTGDTDPTDPDGTATGATDTTGPPIGCDGAEGEPDDACPSATPFCVGGTCSGCDALGDGTAGCGAADATHPICSDEGECVACEEHGECPTGACRIATGECFPAANRLWVDNTAPNCAAGTGSEAAPFCQITTAMGVVGDQAGMDPWAIFVAGSPTAYTGTIDPGGDRPIAIVGPTAGLSAVLNGGASWAIDLWAQSPETYVANMTLRAQNDVMRGGGGCEMWLTDIAIDNGEIGISTGGCIIHTKRALVTAMNVYGAHVEDGGELDALFTDFDNGSGGLLVEGTARLRGSFVRNHYVGGGIHIVGGQLNLENSFVTYNQYDNDGIENEGGGFTILYSTIVGAITCTNPQASTIRNSIVLNHNFEAGQVCTQAQVDNSVVNAGAGQGDGNVLATPADLPAIFVDPSEVVDGDYHLLPGAIPMGVAVWQDGDPAIDADGDARPDMPGDPDYAGADVP